MQCLEILYQITDFWLSRGVKDEWMSNLTKKCAHQEDFPYFLIKFNRSGKMG